MRAPRNIVSKTLELKLRCADFLDEGDSDVAAARRLAAEFAGKIEAAKHRRINAKAVGAFRRGDYAKIQASRLAQRDAAADVRMILGGDKDAGAVFAQAGLAEIAAELHGAIRKMRAEQKADPKTLAQISRSLARIVELRQAEATAQRAIAATQIKGAIEDRKLSGAELTAEVDRIMGIRK